MQKQADFCKFKANQNYASVVGSSKLERSESSRPKSRTLQGPKKDLWRRLSGSECPQDPDMKTGQGEALLAVQLLHAPASAPGQFPLATLNCPQPWTLHPLGFIQLLSNFTRKM